ncbi:MAG TPA: MoxR family ATPase [Candidatus Eisenbacteria bacterium]|jgi:MoxR-like ATPase|nr:MoxR family ATPase [Candidatus Eisenbacteria bacterium]
MENGSVAAFGDRIVRNVSRVLVGKEAEIELCVMALLSRGHVLIEDVPGVGKTMLAKSLSRSLGCAFERLQFTPDLLPADVTGVNIYSPSTQQFEFRQGPIFAQVVLADEINRATPKTQSALLEAMEERQVTVDGTTYPLPQPFIVLATQNPVEFAGTFPLPEAQVDRFLMKVNLGYLDIAHEVQVLDRFQTESPIESLETVASADEVVQNQRAVQQIYVDQQLKEYIARLTHRTRSHSDVSLGASSRGSLGLFRTAQARAALEDRDFVTPDDVKALAHSVLSHRVILKPNAELRGLTPAKIVSQILESEPVPALSVVSHLGRRASR